MDNRSLPQPQVRHSGVSVVPRTYLRTRNIARLLTCPFCNHIYRKATTINRCNHTFCKECIYQKVQEGITCCPTCNEDLSHFSPDEYLRPDQLLRNIVRTLFGNSGRTEQTETPQIMQPQIASAISESSPAQEDVSETPPQIATTTSELAAPEVVSEAKMKPKTQKKKRNKTRKRRQFPSCQKQDEGTDEIEMVLEETLESNSAGLDESVAAKGKNIEASSEIVASKGKSKGDNKEVSYEIQLSFERAKKFQSVWCRLVPQKDKRGHAYPKLTKPYIHVKDADTSTSIINKFLMKKLNLESEDEVEVCCFGEPIIKSLTLRSVIDIWIDCVTSAPKNYLKSAGKAKELDEKMFVMELTYRRKKKLESPNKTKMFGQSSR